MKAMIFAAGEGRRMRPLTLEKPKPLLLAGSCSLLEHQLQKLIAAGVSECVINVSYLAEQIETALKQMDLGGITLSLSFEEEPLETGGGLLKALPLLGHEPFLLVNADVWTDYDYSQLLKRSLDEGELAHLVLIPNPPFKETGDFDFTCGERIGPLAASQEAGWTFSGISLIDPRLISAYSKARSIFPMKEALLEAMHANRVTGSIFKGEWDDIGTPERLLSLQQRLA
ncbi:nucleotidyltransferase family protein [Agaribacterium sp. ZY112]|uniref:nucleotidyltransferase family protein n=1 Tax=Agaribacterium sp. ZY112 TaxID=3233574 RepID=UPI0035235651